MPFRLCLSKVKRYDFSFTHLRAMGRHLPYGITQCVLPAPDTCERAPPNPSQKGWYSIYHYLPRMDARLSWTRWPVTYETVCTCPQTVAHPSIDRARRRVTSLIATNALPLSQITNQKSHGRHYGKTNRFAVTALSNKQGCLRDRRTTDEVQRVTLPAITRGPPTCIIAWRKWLALLQCRVSTERQLTWQRRR